jgi:hypothetical protein
MKQLIPAAALLALLAPPLQAADGLSGAWTSAGTPAQTYVFKVQGDQLTGIVCGPCDDPAAVFRIEGGTILDANRMVFSINYDVGGPQFKQYGPYRDQVTATRSGNQLAIRSQRLGATPNPFGDVLKRVVSDYAGLSMPAAVVTGAIAPAIGSSPSPIEGRWIAAGRVTQQNFILKIRDNKVWGLVCGPCNPAGVFMIDDGMVDGNALTFYINHIDTPPSTQRTGLSRNIMRGALTGNVMKFKWVREGAETEPGGDMVLIGPIRQ